MLEKVSANSMNGILNRFLVSIMCKERFSSGIPLLNGRKKMREQRT